jgi:hypothetical protein
MIPPLLDCNALGANVYPLDLVHRFDLGLIAANVDFYSVS